MAIDQSIINFAVYEDSIEYAGMAKVTLPDVTFLTQSISGAGIGGNEFDGVRQQIDHHLHQAVAVGQHLLDRDLVIGDVGNFLDLVAVGGFIGKDRILHADALDEADGHASLVAHVEQLVFERGTAAVQNKNEHVFLFPLKILPMPRWAFVAG